MTAAAFTVHESYFVGTTKVVNHVTVNKLKPLQASSDNNVEEFGLYRNDPQWQERSKKWILLVDDEASIRKSVGQLLYEKGYQVTACADGKAALQMAHSQHIDADGRQSRALPDVIISDIRMPNMDGLELLSRIRKDPELVDIPVVLLTAKGMTQDRITGYQYGADAYLPKPFDGEELVSILDNLIARREAMSTTNISMEDLQQDVEDIKHLLLQKGGTGVGNGWMQATNVFLAPDERQVLELLCEGLVNKEIAQRTYLSTRRVEQLLTGMYRKADVKNRTELVRWAISTGQVQL